MKMILFTFCVMGMSLVAELVPAFTSAGYSVPQPHHVMTFPRDHGSHPGFRIEWWYVTGHLTDDTGERHGFQLTFFRNALRPPAEQTDTENTFLGQDQLHMAHVAWVEEKADKFTAEERLARNGWDAAASEERMDIFQGNWWLKAQDDSANPQMKTFFSVRDRIQAQLSLVPIKPFVRFGENGVERKGAEPTAASYYLTWTRIKVEGDIKVGDASRKVTGEAWMDHEISSSQLGKEQVGWDWASIQLQDGREIMMYILRREDGTIDPYSVLYWIDQDGKLTPQTPAQFTWKPRRFWTSPQSGGHYPIDADLTVNDPLTDEAITLELRSVRDAQEHDGRIGGIAYWEGACEVLQNGKPAGRAYLELTGYAESLGSALGSD